MNTAAERLATCAAGLFQYLKIARGMLEAIADQPSGQQSSLSELVGAFPKDLKDLYTEYLGDRARRLNFPVPLHPSIIRPCVRPHPRSAVPALATWNLLGP